MSSKTQKASKEISNEHRLFFKELSDLFTKHNFTLENGIRHLPFLKALDQNGKSVFYLCPEIQKNGDVLIENHLIHSKKSKNLKK
jgi:hypothetical protein